MAKGKSIIHDYKFNFVDKIGPTYCGAKWYNATIWLGHGQTTSCHHPPSHAIDLEEIKNWIPGFSITKCDPMQLKDMKVATKRLKLALEKKEKVFLFGDYDVDGTTAVATLSLGLKNAGWDIITYIPCLLYTSPSPRDATLSRMPSSA